MKKANIQNKNNKITLIMFILVLIFSNDLLMNIIFIFLKVFTKLLILNYNLLKFYEKATKKRNKQSKRIKK